MDYVLANWPQLLEVVVLIGAMLLLLWRWNLRRSATSRGKKSPLEYMSARQLRAIARRYGYRISGKVGNTWGRVLLFLVALVLPAFGIAFGIIFGIDGFLNLVVGGSIPLSLQIIAAGALSLPGIVYGAWQLNWITVVPQLTGRKALHLFTRRVHVYLQGINITFGPFEAISPEEDDLTLRSNIESQSATFRTKDKVRVTFERPMLRSRVFPPLLLLNASHDTTTIQQASTNLVQNAMNDEILQTDVEDMQKTETLDKLQENLILALEGIDGSGKPDLHHRDIKGSTYEEQYGVIAETIPFGVPEPSESYNVATEGKVTMAQLLKTADDIIASKGPTEGEPGVTRSEALDIAMANVGKATRQVTKFGIDERTERGLANAAEIIRGGGPLLGAAATQVASTAKRLRGGGETEPPHGEGDH